jgi:hypothetical protein
MLTPLQAYYQPHLRVASVAGVVLSELNADHEDYLNTSAITVEKAVWLLDSNHSIILNGVQNMNHLPTCLKDLFQEFSKLKFPEVNAYFSSLSGSALPPHQDTTDTFIVQVEGAKIWRLCVPSWKYSASIPLFDADHAMMDWLQGMSRYHCSRPPSRITAHARRLLPLLTPTVSYHVSLLTPAVCYHCSRPLSRADSCNDLSMHMHDGRSNVSLYLMCLHLF